MDRIFVIVLMGCLAVFGIRETEKPEKIHGVSLVAPRDSTNFQELMTLGDIGAQWVAVIPFAFSRPDEPAVSFDHPRQWWGERTDGTRIAVHQAHARGFKVMIKPHVWVREQGWPGEFTLKNESDWKKWESEYSRYVLAYARIARETQAEMFCIGTEFRIAVRERPEFWSRLISEVRAIYEGKLTYAANWDNFEHVSFWSSLDYIGIDAYFPLSDAPVPTVKELQKGWREPGLRLKEISKTHGRRILFTEFGYRSTEYTADGHWKRSLEQLNGNPQAQANGYEALFTTVWQESWFAGGFLWKWHISIPARPEFMAKAYSPQGKPAMQVISRYYGAGKSFIPE